MDSMSHQRISIRLAVALAITLAGGAARAQSSSFTYQGRLTDGGTAANGNYDLQFTLWDSLSGGAQIGSTQTVNNVVVSNGGFTVSLDFGANSFPGANRFLEISARPSGGGSLTLLNPRQQVTSTPYAVRSASTASADALSGLCSGCVTDANITSLAGSKITGTISVNAVPAGSGNYIQNSPSQQSASNFNISGSGTASGNLTGANLITNGGVGIGTVSFLRPPSMQFGADINAAFTVSPSDGTPNAGYIRFGDSTGWKLHFGRSREKSAAIGGTLNTGTAGALLTIQDDGNVGLSNTNPTFRLHVVDPGNTGLRVQTNSTGGTVASFGGNGDFQIDAVNVPGGRLIVGENGNVGIGTPPAGNFRLSITSSDNGVGVTALNGVPLNGFTNSGTGVWGESSTGKGVLGQSTKLIGVSGESGGGVGVRAESGSGNLVEGYSLATRKFHISNDGTYTDGSDFAEAMPGRGGKNNYEPGDVLIVSATVSGTVEKSRRPNDVRLAGVYSTRPGMLGADKHGTSRVDADELPVAIVGIVPTKVSTENGPIQVGDLLTTSSTPGYAMKASPMRIGRARVYRTGTILGKALEPLKERKGVIKVLVTLR